MLAKARQLLPEELSSATGKLGCWVLIKQSLDRRRERDRNESGAKETIGVTLYGKTKTDAATDVPTQPATSKNV